MSRIAGDAPRGTAERRTAGEGAAEEPQGPARRPRAGDRPHERRAVSLQPPPPEIRSQADAERYIFQEKKRATQDGTTKDVFFLILYPRQRGDFPTGPQLEQIRQWFKDVPHGVDVP